MKYFVTENSELFTSDDLPFNRCTIQECIEQISQTPIISIDTETEGFFDHKNKVLLIQVGNSNSQYVIDTTSVIIPQEFWNILSSDQYLKIGHNIKFDYKMLKFTFGVELENVYDTMLAECVLNCGRQNVGYSLEDLAKRYLDVQLDKEARDSFSKKKHDGVHYTSREVVYSAEDVEYLEKIRSSQLRSIEQFELKTVLDLENRAVLAFADMEYNGMKIDKIKWLDIAAETLANTNEQIEKLDKIVLAEDILKKHHKYQGDMFSDTPRLSINWSSPKQVLDILQKIGMDVASTDARNLYGIQHSHVLIPELIRYKKQVKLNKSFGINFLDHVNPQTQRVSPDFWQILNTGRVSCKNPNLQQIPSKGEYGKRIRECFIPEPGNVIVGGDYSGCELRIIAHGSQDPVWIKEFKGEGKVHDIVACMMFGVEMDQVKDTPDFLHGQSYRDVAKTIDFGLAYGMSEYKLADTVQISVDEARELIQKFFRAFPVIKGFLDKLGKFSKDNGYVRTFKPYKRTRWFPQWHQNLDHYSDGFKILGSIERAGKNTPIQGTNADITKEALAQIRLFIKRHNLQNRIQLVNTIHDEILTECDIAISEPWRKKMAEIMTQVAERVITSIPMPVECNISNYWTK